MEAFAKGVVEGVWDKTAEAVSNAVIKKAAGSLNQIKVNLGIAFSKYLKQSHKKFSHSKTLLYRDQPRDIRDFFVIPTLTTLEEEERAIVAKGASDIFNAYNGQYHRFFIIRGTGGIGKSMLMKHLFLSELEHKKSIPILFELKDINDQQSGYDIIDVIFKVLEVPGSIVTRDAVKYALENGMFLLLLDGYDEIRSELVTDFLKKLNKLCDMYPKSHIIVSTRPSGDFVEFKKFAVLDTAGLNQEQALELIEKLDYEPVAKRRFIRALDDELFKEHKSFASNPLLLTMMFLMYDEYAGVPGKLYLFYERVFDTLLIKHDATKDGYRRQLECGLKEDQFKSVFAEFCCKTYFNGQLDFTQEKLLGILSKIRGSLSEDAINFDPAKYALDLTNFVCMLYKDGSYYRFTHRSFQEYFTAVYLKDQVDEIMQKRGLDIIKHDLRKANTDNVFDMLREMSSVKLEKNIILPILQEIEADFFGDDKYDFYFDRVFDKLAFISDEDDRIHTWHSAEYIESLTHFAFYLTWSAYDSHNCDLKNAAKLLKQHLNYNGFVQIYKITKEDQEAYELLKKTIVGQEILYFSKERERLESKFAQSAKDDDFFDL